MEATVLSFLVIIPAPDGFKNRNENPIAYPITTRELKIKSTRVPYVHDSVRIFCRHPDDVDLWTAGLMERPISRNAFVGPTFACILGRQFRGLKYGDRFFYTHGPTEKGRRAHLSDGLSSSKTNAPNVYLLPLQKFREEPRRTRDMYHSATAYI